MLIKVMPGVVSNAWPVLSKLIEHSHIPLIRVNQEDLNSIFERILTNELTCWFGCQNEDIHTVAITEVLEQRSTKTNNLFILVFTILTKVEPGEYISMLDTLKGYAKANNCLNVYSYSANEKLNEILNSYGADTSYRLIKLEL